MKQLKRIPKISVKQLKRIHIKDLHLDPDNARKHSDKNLDAISGSLRLFGQQKPIVVDKNGRVIAGNGTLVAAQKLGWDTIDVIETELSGPELMAYVLADNRSSELAQWDDEVLMMALKSLNDMEFDLGSIGFTPPNEKEFENKELNEDDFTNFKHQCPRCGFEFDKPMVSEVKLGKP